MLSHGPTAGVVGSAVGTVAIDWNNPWTNCGLVVQELQFQGLVAGF